MAFQEKQLAQARENSTNAVSVYSPAADTTAIIKHIDIVNTSAAAASVTLYCDDNGTTYDETTTIAPGNAINIPAGESISMNVFKPMNNSSGNFAYKSSIANALTITLWGVEIT